MANDGPQELDQHPRRDDLARLVRTVALSAADEHRARFADGLEELIRDAQLAAEDGRIGTFNALKALQRAEPPVPEGRRILGRLLARGVSLDPPVQPEAEERLVESLAWLAAHSYLDALSALDSELDEALAARLWRALATMVRTVDQRGAARGRAEALAAAAALAASTSAAAREACTALTRELADPLLAHAAQRGAAPSQWSSPPAASLQGEVVPAPLGPIALFLWCASGLILVRYLGRFVARVLLRCRRPAELTVGASGVTVQAKLDVLGRTVREQRVHIPVTNLARAAREVRYPRIALYAGLGALALGSYFGISLVTDAARAGSPSLLALGAAIFGLGVALDLALSSLWPTRSGQHRVVFVPRKGRTWALSVDDPNAADAALRTLERPRS